MRQRETITANLEGTFDSQVTKSNNRETKDMVQQNDDPQEFGMKTFRVFISSTFADMHAERDYIREHAFRRLATELAQQGYGFLPVDLRGSAEDDSTEPERNVFHMCLRRVDDCRPRFLGLLGDRYGWICYDDSVETSDSLEAERLRRIISDISGETGLSTAEIKNRSMTHIEIYYALKQMTHNGCFFYLRQPLPFAKMRQDAARYQENESKQQALRAWLKQEFSSLPDHVKEYPACWEGEGKPLTNLETLDSLIYHDLHASLWAEIAEHAANAKIDFQSNYLAGFINGSIPRDEVVNRLTDFALSGTGVLLISAEDGSGKSTIMAQLSQRLKTAEAIVLSYFSAVNEEFSQINHLYWRFMAALSQAGFVENDKEIIITDDEADLRGIFAGRLERAAQSHRVVLIIDSIDQLHTTLPNPLLLYGTLPQNAVLIASAGVDMHPPVNMTISRLELDNTQLSDLQLDHLISSCTERYGKTLDSEMRSLVAAKVRQAGGNLLYARLLIDYLMRMTGADYSAYTGADAHRKWMEEAVREMPLDPSGAFASLLKRARIAYGGESVMSIVSLLACTKDGLRTTDLKNAMRALGVQIDDVTLYEIRDMLSCSLRRDLDCDWWKLEYPALTAGMINNYNQEQRVALHSAIVQATVDLDVRDRFKTREFLYHCYMANAQESASLYLCDIKFGMQNANKNELRELRQILSQRSGLEWFLRVIQCFITPLRPAYILDTMLREMRASKHVLPIEQRVELVRKIRDVAQIRGHRLDIRVTGPRYCQEQARYCFALLVESELYKRLNRPEDVKKTLHTAQTEITALVAAFPNDKQAEELSMAINTAAGNPEFALEIALERLKTAPENPFSWHDASVAHLSRANKRYKSDRAGALADYGEAVKLMEEAMKKSAHTIFTQDLSWESEMANAYLARGVALQSSSQKDAEADFRRAMEYLAPFLTAHPDDVRLVSVFASAALSAARITTSDQALKLYEKGAAAFNGVGSAAFHDNGIYNLYSAICAGGSAVCGAAGDARGVIEWYSRLEHIIITRFGEQTANAGSESLKNICITLAQAYQMIGDQKQAQAYSRRALEIQKRLEGK